LAGRLFSVGGAVSFPLRAWGSWLPFGIAMLSAKTRDKAAALRFMKALKRHGSPEAITADGLRSYEAAMDELGNTRKQEIGRWANNRVENSHPAIPKTRAGDAQVPANEEPEEVRLGPCQSPQPLQP
jgi:transposase-like protein